MLLELELPFWIEREDVGVDFGRAQLRVGVRNTLQLARTYWRNRSAGGRLAAAFVGILGLVCAAGCGCQRAVAKHAGAAGGRQRIAQGMRDNLGAPLAGMAGMHCQHAFCAGSKPWLPAPPLCPAARRRLGTRTTP